MLTPKSIKPVIQLFTPETVKKTKKKETFHQKIKRRLSEKNVVCDEFLAIQGASKAGFFQN